MPAWITSLLRELVSLPMASAASSTRTSLPATASARATARPMIPAPATTHSALSVMRRSRGRRIGEDGAATGAADIRRPPHQIALGEP